MNLLKNLGTRHGFNAAFGVLFVALLGVAVLAFVEFSSFRQTLDSTQGKEAYLGRAQSSLWELRYGFPQFLVLTDDENRRKIVTAEEGLYKTLEDNLKKYGDAPGLAPEEAEGYKKARDAFIAYKERRGQWFKLIAEGKSEEAAAWRAQYTTPLGAATVKAFNELIDATAKHDAQRREHQAQELSAVQRGLAVLLAIALLVAGLVAWAVHRMTAARLADLTKSIENNEVLNNSVVSLLRAVAQLARKDLTTTVPVTEDVTGPVADALNLLTQETAQVLRRVTEISGDVSVASLKVMQQSTSVMKAAQVEREQVDQTADALKLASESMREISTMAQQSNLTAEKAIATTQDALLIVNNTVDGINSTRDTIRETEKRIKRLGERSQEISVAVGLINTIAERTHILALNAAMHAASAGEAGRGFAVVADEVQRLAESARESTQQIATLVSNIQVETADTVNAMNVAITQVVDGAKTAEHAGRQMQATQQTTAELVASVQKIAAQSSAQARSTTELVQRADLIKKSTLETSQQLTEQTEQTNALVTYAHNLLEAVRVFKLPAKA